MNEEICSKCGESKQASEVVIVRRGNLNHYDHSFDRTLLLPPAGQHLKKSSPNFIALPPNRMRSLGDSIPSFSSFVCFRILWFGIGTIRLGNLNPSIQVVVIIINFNIFPINESTINWGGREGGFGLVIPSLPGQGWRGINACCATWEPELHPFPKLIIFSEADDRNKVARLT